jgi:hypothetical protein
MSTKNNVHCPKCGRPAEPTDLTRTRDAMEHGGMHSAAHGLKHHPLLSVLVLVGGAISKRLPRAYRCPHPACGHTFSV